MRTKLTALDRLRRLRRPLLMVGEPHHQDFAARDEAVYDKAMAEKRQPEREREREQAGDDDA
jgi:hypothetical protein